MLITCSKCKIEKNSTEFVKRYDERKKIFAWCKKCHNKTSKDLVQYKRIVCIEHYTQGKFECGCCGEKNIKFLTIDHINNDGGLERKSLKNSYFKFFNEIIKNKFPTTIQISCYNCNCARAKYNGICPHKLGKERYNEEIVFMKNFKEEKEYKQQVIDEKHKKSEEYKKGAKERIANGHARTRKCKNRPSKEELIKLIKTNSMCEVGRMFGVSDNAVRRWCAYYKFDYKKYSKFSLLRKKIT
jgi:hypothetical protein